MDTYARIYEHIEQAPWVVVDPVIARGVRGIAIVADGTYLFAQFKDQESWDELLSRLVEKNLVVFDVRRIIDWPLSMDRPVVDPKLSWGGSRDLARIVREEFGGDTGKLGRFLELDARMNAHTRAAKAARMANVPPTQLVPSELLVEWVRARVSAIDELHRRSLISSGPDGFLSGQVEGRWPFILSLRQIEQTGIHVDAGLVKSLLKTASGPDIAALRSIDGNLRDGFVRSLMNPIGTKTGRLKFEGGFNCLAIPNGPARTVFTSRHEGGLIYTFDFNAVDYRCIVRAIGDEFEELYADADDFHSRTASFIFKEMSPAKRKLVKAIIYAYTYGSSVDTLVRTTGVERDLIELALRKLDERIRPIADFRERLYVKAQSDGFVEPPGGKRVYVSSDDHAGKVLGLYAQTYSSHVFEEAVVEAHRHLASTKSRIVFTVYDEAVVDMHPDDFGEADRIRGAMQSVSGGGWKVRVKKGRSYGEQAQ